MLGPNHRGPYKTRTTSKHEEGGVLASTTGERGRKTTTTTTAKTGTGAREQEDKWREGGVVLGSNHKRWGREGRRQQMGQQGVE